MSDHLKQMYAQAGKSDAFFEETIPVDLWRAQSKPDFKKEVFIMQPHPGYTKKDENGRITKERPPDVKIIERDGRLIVLGCRCIIGHFRGVSLFDAEVTWLGANWLNYHIPAGTPIPPSLMVTRDNYNRGFRATHYTLGPKDDMPLDLFIQTMKAVAKYAVLVERK